MSAPNSPFSHAAPRQPASDRQSSVTTDPHTRWRRVESLFHRALAAPAANRTALLHQWCAGEQDLLAEVLELLQSDSSVQHKLASTPATLPQSTASAPDPWLGRTLGSYRITQVLGRGGMGVVYLGERAVPHALYPQAAIKVVRRNLQHSPALSHFLLERDALARLEHPNIARLLDGGVTPEGIPFLIMEFVDGERLDLVCDRPETSIAEVLRLTIELAGAVAYVHRNLILHRDLKPGNVMVTREGSVKLLDFGTLKLLQPEPSPSFPTAGGALASHIPSAMTEAGMRPVTLRFASPEHIRGERVSTASDVYSLGVLLYRLLAGRFPQTHPQTESPHPQPAPQSSARPSFLDDLRDDRLAPPSAFATRPMPRELAHDLDAITLKCMRFHPAARYPTADALALDLTRALGNQPVEARGSNQRYRARKFFGRHKLALAAGLAALLILAAGLVGIRHETRIALAEQARAEAGVDQERQLAHLLLFDYFTTLQAVPASTAAQRQTVAEASAYLDQLNQDPSLHDPILQLYEVQGYTRLGNVLGNSYNQNLGDEPGAVRALGKAIALSARLRASAPDDLALLNADLDARQSLLSTLISPGKIDEALIVYQNAVPIEERILAGSKLGGKDLARIADFESAVGDLSFRLGAFSLTDRTAAFAHFFRALELEQRAVLLDPSCARCRFAIPVILTRLGTVSEGPDPLTAATRFHQALDRIAALPPAEQAEPKTQRLMRATEDQLGIVEVLTGNKAGIDRMERTRQHFRQISSTDTIDQQSRFDWVLADANIVVIYLFLHRSQDAVNVLKEEVGLTEVLAKIDAGNKLWLLRRAAAQLRLDEAYSNLHHDAEALAFRRQGLPYILQEGQAPSANPLVINLAVFNLDRTQGDPVLELALAQRAVTHARHPDVDEWINLAHAEKRIGDHAATHKAALEAQAVLRNTNGLRNAAFLADAKQLAAF